MNADVYKMIATAVVMLVICAIILIVQLVQNRRSDRCGTGFLLLAVTSAIALAGLLWVNSARAHDHARPEMTPWFKELRSEKGACCDGSDAMHLTNTDWESREGHYRTKIPKTGSDFERARKGATVEMMWVDVPEDAVLTVPNLEGETMVWPMYGYMGASVRCFMPGSMT